MLKLKDPPARQQQSQSHAKRPAPERLVESTSGHEEEIRLLAYRKWEEAGCPPGNGESFWLAAEAEILRRR